MVYIASDIHLGPHIPLTNQTFFQFLKRAATEANALVLVGDVFNVWFGDDIAINSHEPWLQQSLSALRDCAKQIPVYLVHGNRDFLIGKQLCQSLGITLLPEQSLLHTDAGVILLSHGDELCTQDKAYMRFRRVLRMQWLQHLFLTLPFSWRRGIAHYLRNRSEQSHAITGQYPATPITEESLHSEQSHAIARQYPQVHNTLSSNSSRVETPLTEVQPITVATETPSSTSYTSYDIASETLVQIISEYPEIDFVIHGHTHRPAVHAIPKLDSKTRWRYVLSDWELDHGKAHWGFIAVNHGGIHVHSTMPLPATHHPTNDATSQTSPCHSLPSHDQL
nr:UDP-2,3-diacylglucosamine diphosphatase [Pelistega europaea]